MKKINKIDKLINPVLDVAKKRVLVDRNKGNIQEGNKENLLNLFGEI